MSTSLFSLKAHKSTRNLRKISISSPLQAQSSQFLPQSPESPNPSNAMPSTIILRAKYNFEALAPPEISIYKGEYMKLIERPGNGWLKIQRIDQLGTGLIPALYVDIVVNDREKPVSLQWLTEFQEQLKARVSSAHITSVWMSEEKSLWYKLHAKCDSKTEVFCALFLEDFQALHDTVVHEFGPLRAPLLPEQPSVRRSSQMRSRQSRAILATGLDHYIQSVLRLTLETTDVLFNFIENTCARKVTLAKDESLTEDEVNDALCKGSLPVIKEVRSPQKPGSFSPTAPLPPVMASVPSSPQPRDSPQYFGSNYKYLSYLNQLTPLKSQEPKSSPKKERESCGDRESTVTSLGSLIDYYDFSISSLHEADSDRDLRAEDTELQSHWLKLSRKVFSNSHSYTFSGSTSVNEPLTPTLKEPHRDDLLNALSPALANLGFLDEDCSPLQPCMHQEFMENVKEKAGRENDKVWNIIFGEPAPLS